MHLYWRESLAWSLDPPWPTLCPLVGVTHILRFAFENYDSLIILVPDSIKKQSYIKLPLPVCEGVGVC